jgi:hypothetical protein
MSYDHPGKKVHETPSQWKKLGMVVHACLPSYGGKLKIGLSWSRLAQ